MLRQIQGSSVRFVLPAILDKDIYEVCDSKIEKSASMYCLKVIGCLPGS